MDDAIPYLRKLIEKIAKTESFIRHEIDINEVKSNGASYMAQLFKVELKGETAEGERALNLFVKNKIRNENMTLMDIDYIYSNEVLAYVDINKNMQEIQEQANIPVKQRFKMCRFFDVGDKDCIVMEDMTAKGYELYDRFKCLTPEGAKKAVTELAKFHAIFFAMEKLKPDFFKKVIKPIQASWNFDEQWDQFLKHALDETISVIKPENRDRLEKYVPTVTVKMPKFIKSEMSTIKTLCHGDYRSSNLLCKVHNSKIDLLPIDYQQINYGEPTNDFFFLIYLCTDLKFRKQHMENLKHLYYKTLEEYLKNFDLEVNEIWPFNVFEQNFREKQENGLCQSLVFLSFALAAEDNHPDVENEDIGKLTISKNDLFVERINEIVDEFIELGVI